jgi:hypothetical protein
VLFREDHVNSLVKPNRPDRSKIDMHEVKYWTRALKVSKDDLQKAIDRVGNSAATVRKELGLMGAFHK